MRSLSSHYSSRRDSRAASTLDFNLLMVGLSGSVRLDFPFPSKVKATDSRRDMRMARTSSFLISLSIEGELTMDEGIQAIAVGVNQSGCSSSHTGSRLFNH